MLIECKLKRQGGTVVDMGDGTTYHFKDDNTGRHVANITVSKHIAILMGIPEGYAIPDEQLATMVAPAAPGIQPAPEAPPVETKAVVDVAVQQATIDAAKKAEEDPPATAEVATDGAAAELTDDTPIETIREAYRAEIGREPNANYKAQTLIAHIEAARKAKTA